MGGRGMLWWHAYPKGGKKTKQTSEETPRSSQNQMPDESCGIGVSRGRGGMYTEPG